MERASKGTRSRLRAKRRPVANLPPPHHRGAARSHRRVQRNSNPFRRAHLSTPSTRRLSRPPARSSDRNHGACQRARCLRAHRHHAGAAARHPVKREWMPAGISRSYRTPSHPSPPPHSISVDEPFPRDALAEIRPDPSVGGARTGIEAIPLDNHPTPSPRSRHVSRETSCCVPSSKQRTRGDGQHDPLTTVDQRRTT